jgi:hypothetical protein
MSGEGVTVGAGVTCPDGLGDGVPEGTGGEAEF